MKKIVTLTALGACLISADAMASGFNLKEQSATALGNAFAGATAGAEDISYSYFNPAGLIRHKGTQVNMNATWVAPRSRAKSAYAKTPIGPSSSGYTGDIVDAAVIPATYISHQINEKLTAALSINTPYGMVTDYNRGWAGRFHGTYSKVLTVDVTPMMAYKVLDNLSIGAGLQIQYIRAHLKNSVATPFGEDYTSVKGDTVDIGYTLGALYDFNKSTRIGVGYRSQIKHKLKGDIDFSKMPMDQDVFASITTPANLTVGIYHDINDKWSVMAELGQTYWSSFEELRIEGTQGLRSVTEEKWKDTTFYSFGASYKLNEKWKLRAGFAFDQAAVGTTYRTPRIPDSDRRWYSAGVEYKMNENLTVNAGYTYIRADNGKVNLGSTSPHDRTRGTLSATYQNDVHIGGIGFNYNF